MRPKYILKLSAAAAVCTALAAGVFSSAAFAEDYYDPYDQQYTESQDQTVEYIPQEVAPDTVYIPPEQTSSDGNEYFDYYHNDNDEYYYDDVAQEEASQNEESAEESSDLFDPDEVSVDTQELTSKDWEKIKDDLNSQQEQSGESSSAAVKPGTQTSSGRSGSDFGTLKDKSTKDDVNDAWIYLAIGLPLVLAGAGIITIVIIVNTKARKKESAQQTIDEHTASDPLALDSEKVISKPKRTAFGAKHVAAGKAQNKEGLQKDLVDTLDDPKDFDK